MAGFEVCFISSVASARYREVMFNSWDKNDPKDAAVLLELLKQGITQRYIDPLIAGHHDLQELSKTYYQVTLSRTRLQHSILTHYLPLYFPERVNGGTVPALLGGLIIFYISRFLAQ